MHGNKSPAYRNSAGFQTEGPQGLKSPKSKTFLNTLGKDNEAREAQKNPEKQPIDCHSPTRRTTKFPTKNQPFPPPPGELTKQPSGEEKGQSHHDELLRGSCSNVLGKGEWGSLGSSMRNTTKFTLTNKLAQNAKQPPAEQSNNAFKPAPQQQPHGHKDGVPSFLKAHQANKTMAECTSKTPNKLFVDKRGEDGAKGSRTPMKMKSPFETTKSPMNKQPQPDQHIFKSIKGGGGQTSSRPDLNKTSAISKGSEASKGSTDASSKKTWKSLNEIVESKHRERLGLGGSKAQKKCSAVVNGFEIGGELGKGKFGEVFLSRHQQAGFLVALKRVVKSKVVEYKMVPQFCKEIKLHSCLQHPNIVKFYGCFEDPENVYLVMEYMNGGTLFEYLDEAGTLTLRQTVGFLQDIIEALIYMHQKSIAHRDIKPQNIVISSEGVAKLCDFGWSAVIQSSRKTYCGTFDYAPPEMLERKQYDQSVDVWCIGVLTYELLTGRVPFQGEQRAQIMQKILNVDRNKIDYPVALPIEAREFIEALVQKDPQQRPKMADLLSFKVFNLYPRNAKVKKTL